MGIRLKLCKSNFIFNSNKEEFEMARKMKTMDGNHAAAHASYAFSDVAAIYPITPSTPMATNCDAYASRGMKNVFGQVG